MDKGRWSTGFRVASASRTGEIIFQGTRILLGNLRQSRREPSSWRSAIDPPYLPDCGVPLRNLWQTTFRKEVINCLAEERLHRRIFIQSETLEQFGGVPVKVAPNEDLSNPARGNSRA
jgi:hypothetical protein